VGDLTLRNATKFYKSHQTQEGIVKLWFKSYGHGG